MSKLSLLKGTGATASVCSVLASLAVQAAAGWLLALPVVVLVFGTLYFAGTFVYERNSWVSLLSHFKRKDTYKRRYMAPLQTSWAYGSLPGTSLHRQDRIRAKDLYPADRALLSRIVC